MKDAKEQVREAHTSLLIMASDLREYDMKFEVISKKK